MTDPNPQPQTDQHFVLTAAAPVRALAIAAGAAVVALILLIVSAAAKLPVGVLALAILVLVLGVTLGLVAVLLTRRLRTEVTLATPSITVTRGRHSLELAWSEVSEVKLQGSRLTLSAKAGPAGDAIVVNPRRQGNPTFIALMTSIQSRLDSDRGYGGRPF